MHYALYALIGLAAGVLSGLFGIGGGILIVPALIYFLGYSQYKAQGTSLAVFLLPVGLLAAMNYYKKGNVDVVGATTIACALMIGGYFGSKIALSIEEAPLRKVFSVFLVVAAAHLFFKK
jgi:uncharacterized membrane protein YfcA